MRKKGYCSPGFIIIMRLRPVLFMVFFLHVGVLSFAQKVDVSVRNAPVKKVFYQLTKQTGFNFITDAELVKKVRLITLELNGVEMIDVLKQCFKGIATEIIVNVDYKTVVVKEKGHQVAQNENIQIEGKVTDERGDPLAGVYIKVRDGETGTLSDYGGNYRINISGEDNVLVFSFLGLKPEEVKVGNKRIINVKLIQDIAHLKEVVVTGYGNIDKEDYVGSANVLKAEDIGNRAVGSFENLLTGLSSGLSISSSGQPGDIAEVRLRGFGSMNSSSQPLYVIDGVVFDQDNTSGHSGAVSSPMATINPSDIANITVLKDAASASLYGFQGANGVIVITTRQGIASDRLRFYFSAQGGLSQMFSAVKPELVNSEQYMELWTEGELHRLIQQEQGDFTENLYNLYGDKQGYFLNGKNYYQWQKLARQSFNSYYALQKPDGSYYDYDFFGDDADKLPNTDWFDEISRTAGFQQYDFSMNGGSTALKYFLSLGYLDQEGIIINSNLKRYSMRLNLNADDKSKLLNWGLNTSISSTGQSGPLTSGTSYNMPHYAALLLPSVVPAYLEDGSYNFNFPNNLLNGNHNPIASAYENIRKRPQFSLFTSGWARVNFKPWLDFTSDISQYYITGRRVDYLDKDFGSGYVSNGYLTNFNSRRLKISNRNALNFNHSIKNRHRFNALAAVELVDFRQEWNSVGVVNFMNDDKPVLSAGSDVSDWSGSGYGYSMFSLVSRLDYSYRRRYFIGASFRQDKSSRFSPEYRSGNFWSVSGAYRITNEPWEWIKSINKVFNNIKFKGSYGYNGTLPSSYYSWQNLFDGTGRYNSEYALSQTYRGTYDLSWEKNRIWNIGVDMDMFKSRISLSAEYYRRNSSNLLQDVPVSQVSGYSTMLMNTNAGIVNKGFEMDMEAKVLQKQLKWNVKYNISTLSSKYYGLSEDIIGAHIMRNGESVNSWFLYEYAGINSVTGQLAFYSYDKYGNKVIANEDYPSSRRVLGKGIPSVTGGLRNFLAYRGWELSALFTYGWGHKVLDGRSALRTGIDGQSVGYNIDVGQMDRWTPDNIYGTSRIRVHGQLSSGTSSRYLYDGDYLKLKNIRLSYSFSPATFRKLGVSNVSVYSQAENLRVWTDLKGYDPDLQLDGYVVPAKYPTSTTYTLGLNMNF